MADLGNATLHFKGDSKDLDSKTSKVASGVKSAFKTATVAITAATTAVTALVTASVKAYSEFEQLEGGLISLFGDGSEEMNRIIKSSEQAYKDLTMSQNEYLNSFETAYPLVNNGLAENKDAIEYTNKVLQLSSDLFNTYGQSTEYYQNAINWALKGTYSYLDNLNLGIKGTQEGFVEAANSSGILGRTIKDVSELTNDEIIDVITHYAQEYGVLGKTAEEAGTTILGSLNMTKSAWSNLVMGFSKDGADINKLVDEFISSATTLLGNLLPVVETALGSIVDALPALIDKLVSMLPGLLQRLLPTLINSALGLINGLVSALPSIIPVLMDGVIQAVKGLVKVLPTLIQAVLQGAIMIIEALAEELPTLLPEIIDAILEIIPILIDCMPMLIDAGGKLMVGLLQGIMNSIPKILAKLPELGKKIINYWAGLPGQFINIGTNLIKGLWQGISNVTQWIINKIKGFGKSVLNAIKGIFGVHSPSTEFEWIGKMNMVGLEEGMEGMKPSIQRTIDSVFDLQPNISGAMSSTYSPQVQVNVQNNMEFDPLGQVVNRVKTFSGGAKNDYNWGASL